MCYQSLCSRHAVCDLITCIIGLPLQLVTIRNAYDAESDAFCKIMFAFETFTTQTSGFILVVVALDRFFRVWRPYSQHLNYRRAVKVVCVVIIFTGALFTPFIPMYGIHSVDRNGEHTLDPNKSVASMCWVADVEFRSDLTEGYNTAILISFFAGFIFMAVSYILIGVMLSNQTVTTLSISASSETSVQVRSVTTSSLDVAHSSDYSDSETGERFSTHHHSVGRRRSVTKRNPVGNWSESNSTPPIPSSDATVKGKSDIVQMTDVPPFATDDEREAEKNSEIKMASQSPSLPTEPRINYLAVPAISTFSQSESAPTCDIFESTSMNEESTRKRKRSCQYQQAETTVKEANSPVNDEPELGDVILTDETSQSAESTTPQRSISFSLAPMPMTVPRGVVSTQSILKHSSPAEKPSALKMKLAQINLISKSWFRKPKCSMHHKRVQSRTTLTMSILTLCYVIARFAFLNDCFLLLLVCRHHHRHRHYQQHNAQSSPSLN